MRIGRIIAHLLNNEEEMVAVLIGKASLLNVDEDEKQAIKQVLMQDPKSFLKEERLK